MRKSLKRVLACLLCAALLCGFVVVPQANAKQSPAEPEFDISVFDENVIYGKAGETTFVPAGYTFVYEDENGEIYAQQAPADVYISLNALTPEQAKAIAELSGGEESYTVSDSGTVLARRDFDAKEAAEYFDQIQAIMGGKPIQEGAGLSVITDAYTAQSAVRAMVVFEDAPVSKLAGMTVTLGQSLGQAELNASRVIEEKQLTRLEAMEQALGYEMEVSGQFSLISNAVAVTVNYEDLATLNQMEGVKRAYVMPTFSVPETQTNVLDSGLEFVPNMQYAGPAMGANHAWDVGYKGEGMSVAILDTGLSYNNVSFSQEPVDQSRVAYTREDIETILANNELNAEILSSDTSIDTVYYSSKIPFGFNYGDSLTDFGTDDDTWMGHGSHVAGIVAGNLPEEVQEEFHMETMGIAPEAQLIIMKVFDMNGDCYLDYLIAAIEDCIMLGVDCANLSLAVPSGPYYMEGLTEFYDAAYEAGINVVVSAGNDAHTGANSLWGYNYVKSDSVSTGTIGMPGTFDSVLTVASAENAYMFNVEGTVMTWPDARDASIRYNLYYEELDGVSEGMGFQERLGPNEWQWCDSLQNAEGKLLFHPFEGGNADSLIQQAADAGAIGLALIYPTNQDWEAFVEIDATVFDIPVCKVADYNYSWMAEQAPKTLRVEAAWNPLGTEGEMSAFSSWGPTEALTLKPEITGIGGNVFSAHIGDQFAVMSGTSMASPAVAATATLLRQYLRENELVPEQELNYVVNCLLMSTAAPLYDEAHGTYYSVRRQGAGIANIHSAINSSAYITVAGTNKAKLELGDDPEKTGIYEMTFSVVNFSDTDKTYTLDTTVLGQKADGGRLKDGKVTYLTYDYVREMESTITTSLEDGTVTVPAGSTVELTVTVELSEKEKAYYDERFPAGAYVEGFIRLLSNEAVPLVVPFLGFYGNFKDGPILEPGSYGTILGHDRAYTTADQVHNALWGSVNQFDDDTLGYIPMKHYLGDTRVKDIGKIPAAEYDQYSMGRNYTAFYSEQAGISPNGDMNLDTFNLSLGLRRNARQIHYTVTNLNTGEILWEQDSYDIPKSYSDDVYAGGELSKEWLHPVTILNPGTPWENIVYNESACLLENNTLVEIRADVTPEGAPEATETQIFTLYIDNVGPFEPKDVQIGDYYDMMSVNVKPSEYWYTDYCIEANLVYDETNDMWSAMTTLMWFAGSNIPEKGSSVMGGTSFWNFGPNTKNLKLYYDYAGNCSAFEIQGGENLLQYIDLAAEKTTICPGETLTITDVGEADFTKILVWDISDPSIACIVESDGDSATIEGLRHGTVTVSAGFCSGDYLELEYKKDIEIRVVDPAFEALRTKFIDVPGHWAEEDILTAVYYGLFKGMDDTHFAPDAVTTRGQLVTVLHRLEGEPEATKAAAFKDVFADAYYAKAVDWAAENGIVLGCSADVFAPDEAITREQLITILYRYAKYKNADVSMHDDLSAYTDAHTISQYARDAFAWAVAAGLVNGTTDTTLDPHGTAIRAQAATILIRYMAF